MTSRRTLRGDHNQCPGCAAYFNSTRAFNKHRTGDHEGAKRRCLSIAEMIAKGMVLNALLYWVSETRVFIPRAGAILGAV